MKSALLGFLSPLLLLSTPSFLGQTAPASTHAGVTIHQEESGFTVEWFGANEQITFIEHSSDLVNWSWIPVYKIGDGEMLHYHFETDDERLFLRLHSSDDPNAALLAADFSGTRVSNWDTIQLGLDPFDSEDTSGNGLPDVWEWHHFGTLGVDPDADPDGDGLTNFEEFEHGTDPNQWDTDGDGVDDGTEVKLGSDPLNPGIVPVEIKVSGSNSPTGSAPKYEDAPEAGSARGLFSVWPEEDFTVKVMLNEAFEAPADFIRWDVPGEEITNNSIEHTFNWSATGARRIGIQVGELTFETWVDVPNVGTVNRAQAIATLSPWATARIGSWASTAIDYSNNTYPLSPKQDAIRHAYWCALSASDPLVSQQQILYLSTAYEFDNKWNDKHQAFNSTMDLHNNLIGSMVQISLPAQTAAPDTKQILETLEQKYSAGALWIYDGETSERASEGLLLRSNGEEIF